MIVLCFMHWLLLKYRSFLSWNCIRDPQPRTTMNNTNANTGLQVSGSGFKAHDGVSGGSNSPDAPRR